MGTNAGFGRATVEILDRLHRDGPQPTAQIAAWAATHDVDGAEWITWAVANGQIVQVYGEGPDDERARWAISPDLALRRRRA